jgi:hypothetical protein
VLQKEGNLHLDWISLIDNQETAYRWIKSLLTTGTAECLLRPRAEFEEILWHLHCEQRSALRLEGRQVLYFTYPYLLVAPPEETAGAHALLRWPCLVEPPVSGRPEWRLRIDTNHPPAYNRRLFNQLVADIAGDWQQHLQEALSPAPDTLEKLSAFVQELLEKTEIQAGSIQPALAVMPQQSLYPQEGSPSELWWSALLRLDAENWEFTPAVSAYWKSPLAYEDSAIGDLTLARLSPCQYAFFRQVYGQRFALLERDQPQVFADTRIELIKLALWQGKSCLVIARKKAELEQSYDQFVRSPLLQRFAFLWQDEYTDLPVLAGKVKTLDKERTTAANYDALKWRTQLNRSGRFQRQYDTWYNASRQAVFGEKSWSQLLGYYLHFSRIEGKELLASQLNSAQYQFNPVEYRELLKALRTTQPLFGKLTSVHHPLSNLNAAIFIHQTEEESREFIVGTAERLLIIAQRLHQRYVRLQSQYADQLATYHEANYLSLRSALEKVEEQWEDGQTSFGTDTLRSGDRTLKLYGRFSDKYRQALAQKERILTFYEELRAKHQEVEAYDVDWPDQSNSQLLLSLREQLREYRQRLEEWRSGISNRIQEDMLRLNHKTALSALDAGKQIESLEQDLEVFIDEINASGLYQLPFQSKTLTLARQQKNLEEIIDQLEQSQEGLSDYSAFYAWQRNWFSLSELARKTIQAILRSRPDDWEAAFSTWYFYETLQRSYDPFPIVDRSAEDQHMKEVEQLRAQLPGILAKDWESRQNQALSQLKQLSRNWPTSVRQLMAQNGTAIADLFPVAYANPETGAALVKHYDLVILDRAEGLTASDSAEVVNEARQLAALSPITVAETLSGSLLRGMQRGDIPLVTCRNTEQNTLVEYWTSRNIAVAFHQIDGRYQEAGHINEVEVQEAVKLLNGVQQLESHRFPRLGILCWNKQQRDAVLQMLYRIKKERSAGADRVLQLERNGLTVLSIAEAGGQHFDELIVTPGFGQIDHKGHLPAALRELNTAAGARQLTSLVEVLRNADRIHFFNSMPLDEVEARTTWIDRSGEQYLALIAAAAKAMSEHDYASLQELLDIWPVFEEKEKADDALALELSYRLGQLLPDWTWSFRQPQGISEEALIAQAPNGRKIVLLVDGFVASGKCTTLAWENWQQDRLRLGGYQVLSYSSEALWKNPTMACHRLVSRLTGMANQPEEEE